MEHIIEIWAPKFSTNEVLIKSFQVRDGTNRVHFTRSSWPDLLIDAKSIRSCPMIAHGSKGVYAVPRHLFTKAGTNQLEIL